MSAIETKKNNIVLGVCKLDEEENIWAKGSKGAGETII
jgi:hypothetical protein